MCRITPIVRFCRKAFPAREARNLQRLSECCGLQAALILTRSSTKVRANYFENQFASRRPANPADSDRFLNDPSTHVGTLVPNCSQKCFRPATHLKSLLEKIKTAALSNKPTQAAAYPTEASVSPTGTTTSCDAIGR